MTSETINNIRKRVYETNPLIHSITNPISINQCANTVLAVGARPIMAEHPQEVAEITETSQALILNLGNITDMRMKSISVSSAISYAEKIPTVLDAVGVACSDLRRNFAIELIEKNPPTVIKGNYSEINALYNSAYKASGVDAEIKLDSKYMSSVAAKLAQKHKAIILASGKTDIITDGKRIFHVKNGSSMLAKVTGTGCMLGALCGCYLSVVNDITAIAAACTVLGICGELSETDSGTGSFMVNLLDNLSTLSHKVVELKMKPEEFKIENI